MRREEASPVSAPPGRAISSPNTINQPANVSLAAPPFPLLRHPRVDGAGDAAPQLHRHICAAQSHLAETRDTGLHPRSQPLPPAAESPEGTGHPQHSRSPAGPQNRAQLPRGRAGQARVRHSAGRIGARPSPGTAKGTGEHVCSFSSHTQAHSSASSGRGEAPEPTAAARALAKKHRGKERPYRRSIARAPRSCRSEHTAVAWVSQKSHLLCTAHYRNSSSFKPASSCCNRYSRGVLCYSHGVLLL